MIPRNIKAKLPIYCLIALIFLLIFIFYHQNDSLPQKLGRSLNTDTKIHANDRYLKSFSVEGHVFNEKGMEKTLQHNMKSSLVHSFSPYTENRFKEIILEPRQEQRVYANSPALMWYKGELIVIMRIWLEKEYFNEKKAPAPLNQLADNYLYLQKYDNHLKPISAGSVLGLPTPRQWYVGDGPIEPRLFKVDDENVFISYNTGAYLKDEKAIDSTFIWDYNRHLTILPEIKGGSPILRNAAKDRIPRDKHWTPYIDQGKFRMVYNLDPLRILECTTKFLCEFVHFEGPDNYEFKQNRDSLRGGTPWQMYKYPYYYSISHSTLFKRPSYDRIYTINLVVLKATPVPRIVYLGGPIQINSTLMSSVPIVRNDYIQDPFFFPVSMLRETDDAILIGGHLNDYSSILLRITGIKRVLEDVYKEAESQPKDLKGSPMGTLHTSTATLAGKVHKTEFLDINDPWG